MSCSWLLNVFFVICNLMALLKYLWSKNQSNPYDSCCLLVLVDINGKVVDFELNSTFFFHSLQQDRCRSQLSAWQVTFWALEYILLMDCYFQITSLIFNVPNNKCCDLKTGLHCPHQSLTVLDIFRGKFTKRK